MAQFIEEVQEFDYLYNKYSKEFKDKYKKMNCWEIGGGGRDLTWSPQKQRRSSKTTGGPMGNILNA